MAYIAKVNIAEEPVVILAGGEGRRLKSMVHDRPKPLAPINGTPFLKYLLENLYQQGVRQIILSVHYQAGMIREFIENWDQAPGDLSIKIVAEPKPLGTGGALSFVCEATNLKEPFFVTNGDTYLPTGFSEFRKALQSKRAPNAIGMVRVSDTSRYGTVAFDQSTNLILSFAEKLNKKTQGWINSGLYYLNPECLNHSVEAFSLENVIFPELTANESLVGIPLESNFIDIGIPEDLIRFESFLRENEDF